MLIADEEAVNRDILCGLLKSLGFDTREAASGRDCIEQAERWAPDLILMDLWMQDMDGLEATRRLRDHPSLRHVPILAVTAAAFGEDHAAALEAGCNAHVSKPVLIDPLADVLGELLLLEWVRTEPPVDAEPETLEALPPEQAARLAKLVRMGSITAIRGWVDDLVQSGCCPILAGRVPALVEEFDIGGLRSLVETIGSADRSGGTEGEPYACEDVAPDVGWL